MAIETTMNLSDIIDNISIINDTINDMTHLPPDVRSTISEKLNYILDELDRCYDEYGNEDESCYDENEDTDYDEYDYDYEND